MAKKRPRIFVISIIFLICCKIEHLKAGSPSFILSDNVINNSSNSNSSDQNDLKSNKNNFLIEKSKNDSNEFSFENFDQNITENLTISSIDLENIISDNAFTGEINDISEDANKFQDINSNSTSDSIVNNQTNLEIIFDQNINETTLFETENFGPNLKKNELEIAFNESTLDILDTFSNDTTNSNEISITDSQLEFNITDDNFDKNNTASNFDYSTESIEQIEFKQNETELDLIETNFTIFNEKINIFFTYNQEEIINSTIKIKDGCDFNLDCFHDSNISTIIYFYKDKEFISTTTNTSLSLRIQNASKIDEGEYKCEVISLDDQYLNHRSVKISIENIEQIFENKNKKFFPIELKNELYKENINVRKGEYFHQVCTSISNGSDLQIKWLDKNKNVIESEEKFSITTSVFTDKETKMVSILKGKDINDDDYGLYECQSLVSNITQNSQFEIIVDNSIKMDISFSDEVKILEINEYFDFHCSIPVNNDFYMLALYKNNYVIKTSKLNSITHTILNASLDDAGLYECKAFDISDFPSNFQSRTLKIDIVNPHELFVAKNSSFSLRCKEHEWKKIKWGSNGNFTKKLDFSNFKQSDSGRYSCSIDENTDYKVDVLMVDSKEIEITGVLAKKKFSNTRINDQIDQSCLAITNVADVSPNLQIQWYNQNGERLKISENLDIKSYVTNSNPLSKISTLKIKNISLEDFGLYECRISYFYTIKTVEFEIHNSYDKIQPELNEKEIELYQGEYFELICSTDEKIEKEWQINNQSVELFDGIDINDSILIINNASLEMNGSISCKTLKDGIQRSKTIPLIVKPVLSVNISSNVDILNDVIKIESETYLEIQCFGPLDEAVKWSKNNESNFTSENGLLLFNSVTLDDTGFYTCKSENERIKSKKVEIVVIEKEIFTTNIAVTQQSTKKYVVKNDTILEIENGIDVIIYCVTDQEVEGFSSNYFWIKKNKAKMANNADREFNKLTIKNFDKDNIDEYECKYGDYLENSITLTLMIKDGIQPPKVNIEEKNIHLNYGENRTVECKVMGNPKPKVYWLFKNELIDNNKNFEFLGNILFIKNADENSNGEVTCRAVGKDDAFDEKSALISVQDNRILVKIEPNEIIVPVGSDINLRCDIIQPNIGNMPNLKYFWTKDDVILDSFNQRQIDFKALSLNQSGNYGCQVFDGERKSEIQNSMVKVIQTLDTVIITSNFKIDYQNQKLVVKESDKVILKCESQADESQFYWKIKSMNGYSEKYGKELILNNVTPNKSGNYECVVRKSENEKELKYAVKLFALVYEPLKIKIDHFFQNDNLKMTCNIIQGLPSPNITWTKNDFEIENIIEETKTHYHYSILIDQTNKANFGVFKCTAKNDLEEVYEEFHFVSSQTQLQTTTTLPTSTTALPTTTTAFVPVIANWSMNINSSVNYEFHAGSNIEIICNSFSHSNKNDLKFNWKAKFHKQLPSNVKAKSNILSIENLNFENEGQYECKIDNNYDMKTESVIVNLIVKRRPESPTAEIITKIIDLEKEKKISVNCYTKGYPRPKVIWLFNGKEIKNHPNFYSFSNSLLIRNPNIDLNGYITCQAIGHENKIAESSAILVYAYETHPIIDLSIDKNNLTIGSLAMLNCNIRNKKSLWIREFFYDWFKDGKLIEQESKNQIYQLNVTSTSDSGFYSCQAKDAKNTQISNKDEILLQVYEKIEIKIKFVSNFEINNKTIRVKEGDNVTINCITNEIKNHKIQSRWASENIYTDVSKFGVSANGTFRIVNAKLDDSAKYICLSSSNDSKVDSVRDFVSIEVERYEPIELFIYQHDQEHQIEVDCIFEGFPEPSLKWISKNNNSYVDLNQKEIPFGGIKLILNKTETQDIKNFECIAENKFEKKVKEINLSMGKIPHRPVPITEEISETTKISDTFDFTHSGSNQVLLNESRNFTKSKSTNQGLLISTAEETTDTIYYSTPTTTTSTTSTTTTTTTSTTTTSTTSTTTTSTTTTTTTSTTTTSTTSTTTTSKPNVKKMIISSDKLLNLKIGENIDLECSLPNMENQNLIRSWYKPNNQAWPKKISRKNQLLQIRDFDLYISGTYLCSISSTSETKTFNLTIKSKNEGQIHVRLERNYFELNDNQNIEISCKTYPKIGDDQNLIQNIQWLINDKDISNYNNVYAYSNKIAVIGANQSLHGVVTCRAISKKGHFVEDTAVIRMNRQKALYIDIYPKISNPIIGDEIEILCTLESLRDNKDLSNVEFEWRKDGSLIRESDFLTINKNGSLSLTITSLQDSGLYTCQAFDQANLKSNIGKLNIDVLEDKKEASQIKIESDKLIQDKKIILKQRDNVTLNCLINSSEPVVQPKWYMIDGSLVSDYHITSKDGSRLTIKDIQPVHSGRYSCLNMFDIDNFQKSSDHVDIIVEKYVPIEIYTESHENDENYIIECFIKNGYPNPELNWIYNKSRKYKVNKFVDHIEIILNKEDADIYGSYECKASNKYETKSKTFNLEKNKPQIEEFSVEIEKEKIILSEGESSEIYCNIIGSSLDNEKIEWFLNDEFISLKKNFNFKASFNVLKIEDVKKEQSGTIKCIVYDYPQNKSDSVVLEVKENREIYKVEIEPKDPQYFEGDSFEFKCIIKSNSMINNNPKYLKYTWFKSGEIIGNEPKYEMKYIRFGSAGDYYCKVENKLTGRSSNLAKSRLTTLSVPTKFINQGENKTLVCDLEFKNYTKYEWSKIGMDLENDTHKPEEKLLHIRNSRVKDRGDYVCKGFYNDKDFHIKYIRVEVNRVEKPKIITSPSQKTIDSFRKYPSVRCEVVAGIPPPTVEWKRVDGKPMSNRVEIRHNTLNIKDTQAEDVGIYICIAKNDYGEDSKQIMINKPFSLY